MRDVHWKLNTALLLAGAAAVLVSGLLTGLWLAPLAAVLALFLAWQLLNTRRLLDWLDGRITELPRGHGSWTAIYTGIRNLKARSEEQKSQLERIIREYESLTDALPDATVVIDDQDLITWFNDAASGLLSLRKPDDLGHPVTNLLRDPDFANWLVVRESLESALEMPCPHNDQVHLRVNAVRLREGRHLLIFADVTDIHNLEQVRRDFVANVSHELRTPLTVLLGYLETLVDQSPQELQPAVQNMQSQAEQMQDLLEDLLKLSQLQSREYRDEEELVDVPAMLMALKEQAEELSQGEHVLRFEVQPDLRLRGMRADLESAFRNLISNAIRYTPGPGSVTVRWEGRSDGPALIVSDSGIGIPKRDIPRLTERFYRVGSSRSRHSGGTGLGLSIVKHVLNAHQARLVIESELGIGSHFTCQFGADRVAE